MRARPTTRWGRWLGRLNQLLMAAAAIAMALSVAPATSATQAASAATATTGESSLVPLVLLAGAFLGAFTLLDWLDARLR